MKDLASRLALAAVVLGVASGTLATGVASGQASRVGDTFSTGLLGVGDRARWPDVGYDAGNGAYLVVTGQGRIQAVFLNDDGGVIGAPFQVHDWVPYAQTPRTAYSRDLGGFLVVWHQSAPDGKSTAVFGRLVRLGTGPFGATIQLSPWNSFWEMGASVAYSTSTREFLVCWQEVGGSRLWAQRVSIGGTASGDPILVASGGNYHRDPAVGYNPVTGEFWVAYAGVDGLAGYAFTRIQRVSAGAQLVGGPIELGRGLSTYVPELAWNPNTASFLVIWYQGLSRTASAFYGRLVNSDGSVASDVIGMLPYANYDALSVAHGGTSNTFMMVTHDPWSAENLAMQIQATGIPDGTFVATASGGTGNFNPRLAASSSRAEWLLVSSRQFSNIIGQRVTSAIAGGGPQPPPPTPPPSPAPVSAQIELGASQAPGGNNWLFAEGAAGLSLGFDTYYEIENPNPSDVTVRFYFAREDGFTTSTNVVVPPQTRHTVRLRDHVADGAYSVVIQSLTPGLDVFVERSVYWGRSAWGDGGHVSVGENALRQNWYFAEGSRKNGVFANYFLVFNPDNARTANVTLTFYLAGGAGPVTRSVAVAPRARLTFDANSVPELANSDFATRVSSDVGVVAERSMYWGVNMDAGTNTFGAAGPAPTWHFAEGAATPKFDTLLTVLNPNPWPVTIDVTYLGGGGQIGQVRTYSDIAANSRFTLWLTAEVGYAGAVGATITARDNAGIICERSTYWGAGRWVDGANAVGVTRAAPVWHLPAGITRSGFDTFVLIANPNPFPVRVRVRPILENGAVMDIRDIDLPANGRESIWLNHDQRFPNAANTTFSVKVESLSGGHILVEHAIYWGRDAADLWFGGGAAFGVPQAQ